MISRFPILKFKNHKKNHTPKLLPPANSGTLTVSPHNEWSPLLGPPSKPHSNTMIYIRIIYPCSVWELLPNFEFPKSFLTNFVHFSRILTQSIRRTFGTFGAIFACLNNRGTPGPRWGRNEGNLPKIPFRPTALIYEAHYFTTIRPCRHPDFLGSPPWPFRGIDWLPWRFRATCALPVECPVRGSREISFLGRPKNPI